MLINRQTKQKVPILFPNDLVHSNVYDALVMNPIFGLHFDIISAGECTISCTSVSGKSETLGLTFADGDSMVIDTIDYLQDYET